MATINGVEVIGDKIAHDFDLLDKDDGINLANGIETNREATEDNHSDIVRHRTDTDVHVTPEWKNSLVTKAILGLYWTAAQTADIINEISIAGGAKLVKVETLPAVGLEQTIYLVPKADPQAGDVFDEYVWVDGKYEFIGTTKADISNVVKYTDYATSTRGGVIKFSTSHGIVMNADGFLMGSTRTAEQYASNSGNMLINKGTLENVFASKGFAANSDVVHLTSNETIGGIKTFTDNVVIQGGKKVVCNLDNSFLELNGGTTWGKGGSIVLSGQDRTSYTNSVLIVSKSDTNTDILQYQNGELKPYPGNTDDGALGTSTNKWKTFNGINPGALSLPSISYINVDTSSFVLDGSTPNAYTPTADGYLSFYTMNANGNFDIFTGSIETVYIGAHTGSFGFRFSVRKGVKVMMRLACASFGNFRFFPCQGNV